MRLLLHSIIGISALLGTTASAHAAVQPIGPAPDEVVTTSRPTFSWTNPGPTEWGDEIYIARSPETAPSGKFLPENQVDDEADFEQATSHRWSSALAPGKYWWIVGTVRTEGGVTYGHYNAPQPFTIQVPLPSPPTVASPRAGAPILATMDRAKRRYGAWVSFRARSSTATGDRMFVETSTSRATVVDPEDGEVGAFADRLESTDPANAPITWSITDQLFTSPKRWIPAGTYYWHPYELYWWDDDRRYRSFALPPAFTIRPPMQIELAHRSFCTCNGIWTQLRFPRTTDAKGDTNAFTARATVELFRGKRRVHRRVMVVRSGTWTRYVAPRQSAGRFTLRVTTPTWRRSFAISTFDERS